MAENKAIELLFGVAGGGSLDGQSGQRIKGEIDSIVKAISSSGSLELNFTASKKSLESLRKEIINACKDIKVTFQGDIGGGQKSNGGGKTGSGSQAKERKEVTELIKLWNDYWRIVEKASAASARQNSSNLVALYNDKAAQSLSEITAKTQEYNITAAEKEIIDKRTAEMAQKAAEATEVAQAKLADLTKKEEDAASNAVVRLDTLSRFQKTFQTVSDNLGNLKINGRLDSDKIIDYQNRLDALQNEYQKATYGAANLQEAANKISPDALRGFEQELRSIQYDFQQADKEANQLAQNVARQENSYAKLANHIQDYANRIQTSLQRDPVMLQRMQQLIEKIRMGPQAQDGFKNVTAASADFQKLQGEIKAAGLESETLFQTISRIFKTKFGYGMIGAAAMYARKSLIQVYQTVVELDTKLTELQIVSGSTGSAMSRYLDEAADSAKRVAAAITDIIDATTVYRRLGFSMTNSLDFAELTTMYSKVGGVEIGEAESNITAIIKAFDLNNADRLRDAMDKIVTVGNNYAISASELGQGLNNAASALKSTNNSFEESLAILTASNTITQDAAKSSTAIRTISARLTQSNSELEDLGEELDATYNTTAKYREKLLAVTGVDILQENGEAFKSTFQILRELATSWKSLNDLDKASVTYMVAGIRNQNTFSSLMEQWQEAEGVMESVTKSSGAMEKAYEAYTDSIQGRINTLTATLQGLSANILDDDIIKIGVSGLTEIANGLDVIIDQVGILPTLLGGLGIAQFVKSVGGAKLIAPQNAPTYTPAVTRNECAA